MFVAQRAWGNPRFARPTVDEKPLANVTVTGERFLRVDTTLDSGTSDFAVQIEVLAAASEGPLEYRVSAAGQPPQDEWVPLSRTRVSNARSDQFENPLWGSYGTIQPDSGSSPPRRRFDSTISVYVPIGIKNRGRQTLRGGQESTSPN